MNCQRKLNELIGKNVIIWISISCEGFISVVSFEGILKRVGDDKLFVYQDDWNSLQFNINSDILLDVRDGMIVFAIEKQ